MPEESKLSKICLICKKEFFKPYKRSKRFWLKTKYCSHNCLWQSLKGNKFALGYKQTKEARKKIKETMKNRKPWNKGKRTGLIPKTAYKKGERAKNWSGFKPKELHPQWKGGISFEPYGIEFVQELKEKIRKRDNYTCQECNYTEEQLGYPLSPHHIDYDKKNNKEDNLISLCNVCHGQTNFKREDWTRYFKSKRI